MLGVAVAPTVPYDGRAPVECCRIADAAVDLRARDLEERSGVESSPMVSQLSMADRRRIVQACGGPRRECSTGELATEGRSLGGEGGSPPWHLACCATLAHVSCGCAGMASSAKTTSGRSSVHVYEDTDADTDAASTSGTHRLTDTRAEQSQRTRRLYRRIS